MSEGRESLQTVVEIYEISSSAPIFTRVLEESDRVVVYVRSVATAPTSASGDGDA